MLFYPNLMGIIAEDFLGFEKKVIAGITTGATLMAGDQNGVQVVSSATVRFAGDSGDGMQLTGMRFTDTAAMIGNDVATFPDFPAEIRAPAGTVAGVSGFQVNFAASDIHTPGDIVDTLFAMNPAAFKANIRDLKHGGICIVNEDEFTKVNFKKAKYDEGDNPLEDERVLNTYKVFKAPITRLTKDCLADSGMGAKDIARCKNMFALGIAYYLYERPLEHTIRYLESYFGEKKNLPEIAEANVKVLKAGFNFAHTAEMFPIQYRIEKAAIEPGTYRRITGNDALAMGLCAAGELAKKQVIYCSYPITPASGVLENLAALKHYEVKTFQAEDEIAAVCAAIGVSFTGQIGITGTAGPGLALKSEAIGLAAIMELPLVVVNVQRGGPSTGLPTKTEQSDLLQAMYGRNGDCPVVILCAKSPSDCFDVAIEAVRIALTSMVPVVLMSDGYIGNGAEPWKLPNVEDLKPIEVKHAVDPVDFQPYSRDANLVRPWAIPGTPELMHRLGGLEKGHGHGGVSYDPENHQLMTDIRSEKVQRLAERLPEQTVEGEASGDVLLLGWGGTYGSITTASARLREAGKKVSSAHLRYINPFPKNLGTILKNFKHVLIPELNTGQLRQLIRSKYLVDARGLNKIQGLPFRVEEIEQAVDLILSGNWGDHEARSPYMGQVGEDPVTIEERMSVVTAE